MKLISKNQIHSLLMDLNPVYELMFRINSNHKDDKELQSIVGRLETMVKQHNGTVLTLEFSSFLTGFFSLFKRVRSSEKL